MNFYLYRGNGDGTFQPPEVISGIFHVGDRIPLDNHDFNSDGNLDLVLGGLYEEIIYYTGNGDGTFTFGVEIEGWGFVYRINLSAPPYAPTLPGTPVADANPDIQEIHIGGTVSFDGSDSYDTDGGTIVSFEWDFRDGTTAAGATASHTYTTENTYAVKLTVTDNDGKADKDYARVLVQGDPPVADADGPYGSRPDVLLTFDAGGSSDDYGISRYVWDFGDGNVKGGATPTHSYSAAGDYTVMLTVYDAAGQSSTSTTTASITDWPEYFVYAQYWPGHEVYAIESYSDLIYVSDQYGTAYMYRVTIPPGADPNAHPDNPGAPGDMAPRTFAQVGEPYDFSADCGWFGDHNAEFYISESYIYYGPNDFIAEGGIETWERNPDGSFGAYLGRLPIPTLSVNGETFGFDADNSIFYTCTRKREVYTYQIGVDTDWQYEFTYPDYLGDHHDGLEYVSGYLWLSDMTSDYIGQWEYTGTGPYNGWEEVTRYQYSNPEYVEGMGFGALGHFWVSSGWEPGVIYEIGGGELQIAVERIPDQCIYVGESFESFDLDDYVIGTPPYTWEWTGNEIIDISVDGENVITVAYPVGWWGEEKVTFTVTDANGSIATDEVTFTAFTVNPVPRVYSIPGQYPPYEAFDLDDYIDASSVISPAHVIWTAEGMTCFGIEIDPLTHIVTIDDQGGSCVETETITFIATISGCGTETLSDSVDVMFGVLPVPLDIKPMSCPNPLNTKVRGRGLRDIGIDNTPAAARSTPDDQPRAGALLPVAILGTADFDVTEVDPSTILLEGISPVHSAYEDIATPVGGGAEACECTAEGADGCIDLTLKFDVGLIVDALGEVNDGDTIPLTIAGNLFDGTVISGTDCVIIRHGSGTTDEPAPPGSGAAAVALLGNYPNPFNPTTEISFTLPGAVDVKLEIYNILGRKVTTLVDGPLEAGEHVAQWDGSAAASGVYLYRLEAGGFVDTKKMVLLK